MNTPQALQNFVDDELMRAVLLVEQTFESAIDGLRRDQNEEPGIDSNGDVWARPLPPLDVPGGKLSGRLRELNGCFNLNHLVVNGAEDALARRRFERLLRAVIDHATLAAMEVTGEAAASEMLTRVLKHDETLALPPAAPAVAGR